MVQDGCEQLGRQDGLRVDHLRVPQRAEDIITSRAVDLDLLQGVEGRGVALVVLGLGQRGRGTAAHVVNGCVGEK